MAGQPASGTQVSLYRKLNLPSVPADIDDTPEITGTTDSNGLFSLPNLPVLGGTTTPTSHVLHPNPFGMVDITGEQNRYLVKITKREHEEFQWLDVTPFNLAFWQGHADSYTHTLQTHLPVAGAPSAPTLAGKVQGDFLTIYWGEYSDPNILYNVYWMGPPDFQYIKVSDLRLFPWYSASFSDTGFYLVSTVVNGKESGFSNPVWLPRLYSPTSVVVNPDGNVLVQDSQNNYNFPILSPSGRWLYTQPVTELSAYNTRFFTLNPAGWLVISQSYSAPNDPMSIHLYNPQNEAGFAIGDHGNGQVGYPTGVAWWGEQSYSVQGPYSIDSDTLFLAHYDGSFSDVNGQVATNHDASFTSGKFGQAALFEAGDVITYTNTLNLQGFIRAAIEFWVRPAWNGDDYQNHTFLEVGEAFNTGMVIMKDGANNLRFIRWDYLGHEFGVYCPVSSWKAGNWHHVAAAWDENWMMLAVDGVPCQTSTEGGLLGLFMQPPPIYIGDSKTGGQPAQAAIDELRFSDLPRFGNTQQLRILVADADYSANRIVALDGLGNLVTSFGSTGSGTDQLNNPQGLAVSQAGEVIVVDSGNNRLQVLGFDGNQFTLLRTITGGFNAPTGAAAYLDWLVVADTGNNQIKVLEPSGNLAATYDAPDSQFLIASPFLEPLGVAVDRRGEIMVADTGHQRVVRITDNVLPKNYIHLPFVRR